MEEPRCLEAQHTFGLGPHTLRLLLGPSRLEVEVEAHLTAQRWRGQFPASSIEELTQKTGNFKQFGVFCSMLEAALRQSSECVSLELLTLADLQTLRSQKLGGLPRAPQHPPAPPPLSNRRYLILVYCVEFDRIHYPLPLPYVGGVSNPCAGDLREQLRRLRLERDRQVQRLQQELQRVLGEKRAAEAALERERSRHQRHQRLLGSQLAEAQAAERRLQQRVRSLEAELGACRRGSSAGSGSRRSPATQRRGRVGTPSPAPTAPRPPRSHPSGSARARRPQEAELKNQRRGATPSSASPARSRGRSSSAGSCRSRRSAEEPPQPQPRRKVTGTRRPLSASSCNSPSRTSCPPPAHKPAVATAAANKRRGKENHCEEPELAEIDARLRALQEYMDRLDPWV